jgi:F-type H+-transporting ATPase subunit a
MRTILGTLLGTATAAALWAGAAFLLPLPAAAAAASHASVVAPGPLQPQEHRTPGAAPVEAAAQEAVGETAQGEAEHGAEFDMQEYALHHLADSRTLDFAPFGEVHLPAIRVGPLDLSITKHVVFLWIAATLMLAIFIPMARFQGPVYRGLHNVMEAIVVYVRDQVAVPNIGKEKAGPYVPYLLTLFFFILFANLLGLLPFGATATSNFNVTGSLALLTMFVAEGSSLRHLGPGGYVRQFVPIQMDTRSLVGKLMSFAIVGLLMPIEILSHVMRIFALMIRLFANMLAGHMMILALIGLIFLFRTFFLAPASVGASAAVYLLEIFIAFVQAFIFTFLTALFIGMGVHEHH